MCPDTVDREGRRSLVWAGIGGHPGRAACHGGGCRLVASLLDLHPPPRHAVPRETASTWARKVSPMCPDRSVTHVPGCTRYGLGMDENRVWPSGSIDVARRAQYFTELMKLLVESGGSLPRKQVFDALTKRLDLTPYELERIKTGGLRWTTHLQFYFIGFRKAGFLTREKGTWSITDAGRAALEKFASQGLMEEVHRHYTEWEASRSLEVDYGDEGEEEEDTAASDTESKPRVWLIGTGRGGTEWTRFRDGGFVEVGFARGADARPFGAIDRMTREQVRARMLEVTGETNPYNDVLCAWQFAHEVRPGDLVIAKSGRSRVLGHGQVVGGYEYRPEDSYGHRRVVKWIQTGDVQLPSGYRLPTKTLTNIAKYDGFADVLMGRSTPAAHRSLETVMSSATARAEFLAKHPYRDPSSTAAVLVKPSSTSAVTFDEIDEEAFVPRAELEEMLAALTTKLALVLQGAPGTGKTWLAARLAEHWAGDKARVTRVQFHPATSYEDFVRGLRPTANGGFRAQNGPLAELAERAKAKPEHRFVMLLDEINRANVAKVLGEALSLLEADKREERYAVELGLDLEGDRRFWLPPNVAFVATMNTADRSIAMVDYALRRRFAFFHLKPAYGDPAFRSWLLAQFGRDDDGDLESVADRSETERVADVILRVMAELNRRIVASKSLGAGFALGHSYFCSFGVGRVEPPEAWMRRVFRTEILAQVEEYCADHPRLLGELMEPLREVIG